jgi:hypothetical protein
MDCELKDRERYIAEYVNSTLPEEDLSRFEEHYFQCRQCLMEVQAVVDAASIISADGKRLADRPPPRKKAFLNISMSSAAGSRVKWGIAFASAALIILMIILSDVNNRIEDTYTGEKETYSDPVITDKEPEPVHGDDLAAMTGPSFEPSQYMEEWITETQRSSAGNVKVIAPVPGKIFSDEDVQFSLQTREEPIYLIILSNQEEEVFSARIQAGHRMILAEKEIFPGAGLYYWKIENEEEVIYTGKFYYLKTEK